MVINIAKGILLLVLLNSSLILTFINIKINKNKIDTAPTYTNKYERPIKFKPNIIRYDAMLKNNPIKNKTDNTGFFIIITSIPHKIASTEIMSNTSTLYPFV